MQTSSNAQDHSTERNSIRSNLRQSYDNSCAKVEQCVKSDPRTAMLVSIGAGLGLGLLVGLVLGGSRRQQTSSWFDRNTAERLGQRMMAGLGDWVPDSIHDRIGG